MGLARSVYALSPLNHPFTMGSYWAIPLLSMEGSISPYLLETCHFGGLRSLTLQMAPRVITLPQLATLAIHPIKVTS